MRKILKFLIIFTFLLIGCNSKESLKYGTYGVQSKEVNSAWNSSKYIFKEDKTIDYYILSTIENDGIITMEYTLSKSYDYNIEGKTLKFGIYTFVIKNNSLVSDELILNYESSVTNKPKYKVVSATVGGLSLQLNDSFHWVVNAAIKTQSNFEIESIYKDYVITTIDDNVFSMNENLESVVLPSSITSIGSNVFPVKNAGVLTIVFTSAIPCNQDGMLSGMDNVKIVVPHDSVELYKNSWSEYSSIIIGDDC